MEQTASSTDDIYRGSWIRGGCGYNDDDANAGVEFVKGWRKQLKRSIDLLIVR